MNTINHVIAFTDIGQVEIREYPMFACDKDKMIIKTDYCALCTYEQRVFSGTHKAEFPCILGHEVSGTIIEIGDELKGKWFEVGDKVVVGANLPCGTCYHCRTGHAESCPNFKNLKYQPGSPLPGSGAMQEYLMQGPNTVFKYLDTNKENIWISNPNINFLFF